MWILIYETGTETRIERFRFRWQFNNRIGDLRESGIDTDVMRWTTIPRSLRTQPPFGERR